MRFSQLMTVTGLVDMSAAHSITPLSARNTKGTPAPGFLKPINANSFKKIGRRGDAHVDFAGLEPQQQAELLYGSPGANGQMVLANMVLKAPTGLPIVLMESFEQLTSEVECNGDDNLLSIKFKSEESLTWAEAQWDWVNEDANLNFLIITNHEGCNPVDQRQPYKVIDVETDEANLITYLSTVPVPWSDITGNYRIDFGLAAPDPAQTVAKRSSAGDWFRDKKDRVSNWWDETTEETKEDFQDFKEEVTEIKEDVVEDIKGIVDINHEKATEWDLAAGQAGVKHNIFTWPFLPPLITVDCVDCYTTGRFKLAGVIDVVDADIKELSIRGSFADFKAVVKIDTLLNKIIPAASNNVTTLTKTKSAFSLSSADKDDKFEAEVDLIEMPVPGAGVVIPGIFELGLVGTIEAGFNALFKGVAGFTVGMEVGLPNDAEFFLDIVDPEKSYATGFETAYADPSFSINNASVTIDASIFFRPKLELKAEITGIGSASADIFINLPVLNVNGTATYDADGACPESPEIKTGIVLATGGQIQLNTGISATFGTFGGRLWLKTLASHSLFQKSQCFPIEILEYFDFMTDGSVPTIDAPAEPAPVEGAPPVDPAPVEGAPPVDPAPVEGAPPVEPAPVEGAPPVEPAPVEGAPPVEPAPVEGAPVEGAPVEGAPVEGAPPVEPAPVEGAPPVEPAPVEGAPVEAPAAEVLLETTGLLGMVGVAGQVGALAAAANAAAVPA